MVGLHLLAEAANHLGDVVVGALGLTQSHHKHLVVD